VGSLAAGDSQFRWRSWLIAVVKEGRAGVLPFLAFAPGVTANNQHYKPYPLFLHLTAAP